MNRKKKVSKAKMIEIIIGRFGFAPDEVEIKKGSTVEEALDEAGIELGDREKIWVNSEKADLEDQLEAGDIVNIVSPKEGGRK